MEGISVVVPLYDVSDAARAVAGWAAAATCANRAGLSAEIIVVRPWPLRPELPPTDAAVRVVDVAAPSATAAANAGLASARNALVVLASGADVPERDDLLLRHASLHAPVAAVPNVVVGEALSPDGGVDEIAKAWVGAVPRSAPPLPCRHISAPREVLMRENGLDERLHDLDVAVLDLLARTSAHGTRLAEHREFAVRRLAGTEAERRAALLRAGGAAQTLTRLLEMRGEPMRTIGPKRARATLRWFAPALDGLARAAVPDRARFRTLAARAVFARGRARLDPPHVPIAAGGAFPPPGSGPRPAVAVVVPFAGSAAQASALVASLAELELRDRDEIVVVDNSARPVARGDGRVAVIRAAGERSSYHARNAGWRHASAEWIAFMDADTRPFPKILEEFFATPPGEGTGAIAGAVLHPPVVRGWVRRWSVHADVLGQAASLSSDQPYAVTANLLVRRDVLVELRGFVEGIRSSGDAEFSRRLARLGLAIEYRPRAAVVHEPRGSLAALIRQHARYGAGNGWLARHSREPRRSLVALWGQWGEMGRDIAAARFELAAMRATTFLTFAAQDLGSLLPNRPPGRNPPQPAERVGFAASWPPKRNPAEADRLPVEAVHRPPGPVGGDVWFVEDDAPLDRLAALIWLAACGRARRLVGTAPQKSRARFGDLATLAPVARRVAKRGARELIVLDPEVEQMCSGVAGVTGLPRTSLVELGDPGQPVSNS